MVEVDLRLFVTCRLCLDVQGHFQIDPNVQQQIKYCFDIDVEPFDGLPQLICKKCENILRQYNAVKKNYCDKQKELKKKPPDNARTDKRSPSPQQNEPESHVDKARTNERSPSPQHNKPENHVDKARTDKKSPSLQQNKPESHVDKARTDKRSPSPQQNEPESHVDKMSQVKSLKSNNVLFIQARKGNNSPSLQQNKPESQVDKTKNIPELKLDDSDSSTDAREETRKKKKVIKKRINNRIMSSCSDSEPDDSVKKNIKKNAIRMKTSYEEKVTSWDANFNKYFVCRICSQKFQDKKDIIMHIKEHSSLTRKYKNIFKRGCLVVIENTDNKAKMCSNKPVMYNSDTLILSRYNPFYYIKYHSKNFNVIPSTSKCKSKNNLSSSECTDDEISAPKRRRVMSRSSSETVVINGHSELEDTSHIAHDSNPPTVIDCIDLGDSSDNESYDSCDKSNSSTTYKGTEDYKCMQNIIRICYARYLKHKKNSQNDKGKEDFLQHKLLSIGRKIINNKGFNCVGLLRYLEHKDLSVIWEETSNTNTSHAGKYVRIATRVRGNESSDNNTAAWKNFTSFTFENYDKFNPVTVLKKLKTFENFRKPQDVENNATIKNEEDNMNTVESLPRISSVFSHTSLEITRTDNENLLQKLLNKNPVSNPRQLPKKVTINESYTKKGKGTETHSKPPNKAESSRKKGNSNEINMKNMKVFSAPNTKPFVLAKQININNEKETPTMPIVTSTISLAHLREKDNNVPTAASVSTSNNQKMYPRIKVKPVSELMPEKTTTNGNSEDTHANTVQNVSDLSSVIWNNDKQQIWPAQGNVMVNSPQLWQNQNEIILQTQIWPDQIRVVSSEEHNKTKVSTSVVSQCSNSSDYPKKYLILDTPEFPNTRTDSPIQYLKNLLLLHNITLIDGDEPLPAGFVTLIKLRLIFQQDQFLPISLCLSFHCSRNVFCIQVKDISYNVISITKLSAHWQWQLLKIYNNEVITKILEAASKVNLHTYQLTQQFCTLLRSIKEISDETNNS